MSVLKWIWSLMRRSFEWHVKAWQTLLDLLVQPLTWIVAGISWLCTYVWDLLSGVFDSAFEWISGNVLPEFGLDVPLAFYALREWFAIDTFFDCLAAFFLVWVAAKTARLAMVPIRAILELL